MSMTKSEREDLQRLVRQREKAMQQAAKLRSKQLLAHHEKLLMAKYSFDADPVWSRAMEAVAAIGTEAQTLTEERCAALGIPRKFAPAINFGWRHTGYGNLMAKDTGNGAAQRSHQGGGSGAGSHGQDRHGDGRGADGSLLCGHDHGGGAPVHRWDADGRGSDAAGGGEPKAAAQLRRGGKGDSASFKVSVPLPRSAPPPSCCSAGWGRRGGVTWGEVRTGASSTSASRRRRVSDDVERRAGEAGQGHQGEGGCNSLSCCSSPKTRLSPSCWTVGIRLEAMERADVSREIMPDDWFRVLTHSAISDPVTYIISANVRRRHLTKQQQAELIVAAVEASRKACEMPKRHVKGKAGSERDALKAEAIKVATANDISKRTVEIAIAKKRGGASPSLSASRPSSARVKGR